jgi:hypothetical protein
MFSEKDLLDEANLAVEQEISFLDEVPDERDEEKF